MTGGEADKRLAPIDTQLAIVAAERERIAGELHDDSVQAMTAVSLQLQRLKARMADSAEAELVDQARQTADQAIERLRHMLFVLHPSSLEDDGLVVTLEIYLEAYVEEAGVGWQITGDETIELPVGVAALGFRLAREAISNAMRHAAPTTITVSVELVATADASGEPDIAEDLSIEVHDDGVGFDATEHRSKAGHLGIKHSTSLAETALGSYSVTTRVGAGTTVRIRLPIGSPG